VVNATRGFESLPSPPISPVLPMNDQANHINVCVCTYKRPQLLKRLLTDIAAQDATELFTVSIIVVDNDSLGSAAPVVSDFSATSGVPIQYCTEPLQNIAVARNKAIENAKGEFVAFIDDDEVPSKRWLITLFEALHKYDCAGVLGPVKPYFDDKPPEWVVSGGFYDRPSYPTGFVIDWKKGRTGNVLLRKTVFDSDAEWFRPQFRTGEDQDFFRRMMERGHVFVWCHEAMAYELVPPLRWKLTFLLRRSLLRGATTLRHPTFGAREIVTSMVAIPTYTAALPFALVLGHGRFMLLLVKLFDHLGRILALVGLNPVKEPYVTE
jgi:succinoglycan biosynthesis protein ExoM